MGKRTTIPPAPITLLAGSTAFVAFLAVGVPLAAAISRYQSIDDIRTEDVPGLRDEYAPIDKLLQEQVGERYAVVESNNTTGTSRPAAAG